MDLIKNKLTCKICKKIFNKPVFLPCYNTTCENHINELFYKKLDEINNNDESKTVNKIECLYCEQIHDVPINGFIENDMAKDIIESSSHLNDAEKQIKLELDEIYAELNNYISDFLNSQPQLELFTYEYFFDIKTKIDIHREMLKLKIDTIADKMINQINEQKEKCEQLIKRFQLDNDLLKRENLIKLKNDLDNELRNPRFELAKLEAFKLDIGDKIDLIKAKLVEFDEAKIRIKDCDFEPNEQFDDCQFGELTLIYDFNLISSSADRTIKIWDMNSGSCIQTLKAHHDSVFHIELISENELASCSSDTTIKIWDLNTGECIRTFNDIFSLLCLKKLSPTELVSGSKLGSIKIWDLKMGLCKKMMNGHSDSVNCIEILNESELISSSTDCTIKLWNLNMGICTKTLNGHTSWVNCLKVLPGGLLASGSSDRSVKIWNLNSGQVVVNINGHLAGIRCLKVTPRNELVTGSADKCIKVWDLKSYECKKTLIGHEDTVKHLELLKNDRLISCSHDKTIKIWDLKSGRCIKTLTDHKDIVMSMQLMEKKK